MARTILRGNDAWWAVNSQKYSGGTEGHCDLGRVKESTCVPQQVRFRHIIYKYIHLYCVCINVDVNLYLEAWANATRNSALCKYVSNPLFINQMSNLLKDWSLIHTKSPVFSTGPSGGIPLSPFPVLVCRVIPCQVLYSPDARVSVCSAQGHHLPFPEKWPKINTPPNFYKHNTHFMVVLHHMMGQIISLGNRCL